MRCTNPLRLRFTLGASTFSSLFTFSSSRFLAFFVLFVPIATIFAPTATPPTAATVKLWLKGKMRSGSERIASKKTTDDRVVICY